MSENQKTSSRRYSKRLTAWSLGGFYGLTVYGISVQYPHLADVLAIVGPTAVALLLLYMFIGHRDLQLMISKGTFDLRGKGKADD